MNYEWYNSQGGIFSIKDSMGDVKANHEASAVMNQIVVPLRAKAVKADGKTGYPGICT